MLTMIRFGKPLKTLPRKLGDNLTIEYWIALTRNTSTMRSKSWLVSCYFYSTLQIRGDRSDRFNPDINPYLTLRDGFRNRETSGYLLKLVTVFSKSRGQPEYAGAFLWHGWFRGFAVCETIPLQDNTSCSSDWHMILIQWLISLDSDTSTSSGGKMEGAERLNWLTSRLKEYLIQSESKWAGFEFRNSGGTVSFVQAKACTLIFLNSDKPGSLSPDILQNFHC